MPTVDYTFHFTGTLTEEGLHANVTGAQQATGGQNASDAYARFSTSQKNLANAVEGLMSALRTFETMGVPAGSTVTGVEFVSGYKKVQAVDKLDVAAAHTGDFYLVDDLGNVLATLKSAALGSTVDAGWVSIAAGTTQSLNKASTDQARLRIRYTLSTTGGGGTANVATGFDTVTIRVTYQAGNQSVVANAISGAWSARPATTRGETVTEGFGATDGTLLEGRAPGGGGVWEAAIGDSIQCSGGLGAPSGAGVAGNVVDMGSAEQNWEVEIDQLTGEAGIIGRFSDVNNHWLAYLTPTAVKLDKVSGGVRTNVQNVARTFASKDLLRLEMIGNDLIVSVNGVSAFRVTDTHNNTATKHGLFVQD